MTVKAKSFIGELLTDARSRMGYDQIVIHSFLSDIDLTKIRNSK